MGQRKVAGAFGSVVVARVGGLHSCLSLAEKNWEVQRWH